MIRQPSARVAAVLLALLLLMLLGAQWTGMQHRVAHAWIADGADHAAAAADDGEGLHLVHSCTLFDAAALGATLQSAFFLPACLRAVMTSAKRPQTPSRQAHPFRLFSPRGPPLP